LPEATIFFKHTLWLKVQKCLRRKTFLALEVSTTSQSSTRKNYIQVHKQVSQTWSKPKLKRGVPFKIISSATDGVSQPHVKTQQQVRASQKQS